MISYFALWAGLAAASLHDQASGTPMTRPSARWAVIVSSVTSTRLILASLLAAVLIPCLQNPGQMLFNIRPNDVQLARRELVVAGEGPGRTGKTSQAAQKGPDARRRPPAAREAYSLYVERAAKGANE